LVWRVIKLKEMIAHVQETEMFVPTALKNKKEILNLNI